MATQSLSSRIVRWWRALSPWMRRRRAVVAGLPNETLMGLLNDPVQLRAHFSDPTSYDLHLAMEELKRRGIDVRPSTEELLELLTSTDDRQSLRGLYLLHAVDPDRGRPAPGEVWSNEDAPEAWRERVARITPTGQ